MCRLVGRCCVVLCRVMRAVVGMGSWVVRARAWRTDREASHDASCALLLKGFKLAMGYPEWRPFELIDPHGRALTGRHLARTAMQFAPRSAMGRSVRPRHA